MRHRHVCGATRSSSPPEDWMFLNTGYGDFRAIDHSPAASPTNSSPETGLTDETGHDSASLVTLSARSSQDGHYQRPSDSEIAAIRPLSPFGLSSNDFYLLQYFESWITPQCFLPGAENVYCKVFIPLCLTGLGGPVLSSVLAISANQLRILGRKEYGIATWTSYSKALTELRARVRKYANANTGGSGSGWEDILATSILLCFFNISATCSDSWLAHARCARTILSAQACNSGLPQDLGDLCGLAWTYFATHDVLAGTASSLRYQRWSLDHASNNVQHINTLSGCSNELLDLISETSEMAESMARLNGSEVQCPPVSSTQLAQQRDIVERRLHSLKQLPSAQETLNSRFDEILLLAETKRLAALIYFYGRVDGVLPHQHPVNNLTSKFCDLLERISINTTVLLWPLFIIGTFGIQPEKDEDRKVVLDRLMAMQRTRQLAHVKKARRVIEAVWKARDLRAPHESQSWDLVRGREGSLSLT
ncbi:hypothetical protein LTR56_003019 [Elasticomyces elasticus]|nr:hypothetical protein LTR56_003019 [Elasticomyces elasticus]KAK3662082.1 hypothetical protein LTR22_007054 [Elasticomyces elasticus]KAK4927555.1 hypothetical protein LTR49_005696 [Elasticomyces elasticus]KAK5753232.1 hypothetical protein LTS12_016699 [Elasticomyces elasticus]